MENGYFQLAEGRMERAKISSVRFVIDPLSEENFRMLFAEGHYSEIIAVLNGYRSSLLAASDFPGNASDLLRWLLRACFWQGEYSSVQEINQSLRANHPMAALSSFYETLGLLEQNRLDEASARLAVLETGNRIPPFMIEYVRARIAFDRKQYTEALQYLANVTLAHSRDSEWTPAGVFLEGMIYKKTGQTETVAYVAEELTLGWPESIWSRRAAELKESRTEQGETP